MDYTKDHEKELAAKVAILKKNLEKVGEKELKEKYAKAYNNLRKEIMLLEVDCIQIHVMYVDLSCVFKDSFPKFRELVNKAAQDALKVFYTGDFEGGWKILEDARSAYVDLWCKEYNGIGHIENTPVIPHPFSKEHKLEIGGAVA